MIDSEGAPLRVDNGLYTPWPHDVSPFQGPINAGLSYFGILVAENHAPSASDLPHKFLFPLEVRSVGELRISYMPLLHGD